MHVTANVMVYYKNRNVIVYTHKTFISIGKEAGILHGDRRRSIRLAKPLY